MDYRRGDRNLQGLENRTFSFCLTFFGITARRNHEENVHQRKEKGFKCDLCDKSYSNSNALSYHKNTKHEDIVSKFNCNVCGLKFSTERILSRHRKSIHGGENGSGEVKFDFQNVGQHFRGSIVTYAAPLSKESLVCNDINKLLMVR